VARDREELVRRAKALYAAARGGPGRPELDSARIIGEEQDAWVDPSFGCAVERLGAGRISGLRVQQ
jgi:hypothetical protein